MVGGHALVGAGGGDDFVTFQALALQSCGQRPPKGGDHPGTSWFVFGVGVVGKREKVGQKRSGARGQLAWAAARERRASFFLFLRVCMFGVVQANDAYCGGKAEELFFVFFFW